MKRILTFAAVALLAAAAYFLTPIRDTETSSVHAVAAPQPDPPTATKTDHAEVFKRAFWRPPTARDKILHAERREWSDKDGIKKWQWFIAVEPSPELLKYVREDNAFGLMPAKAEPIDQDAPSWFAFKAGEVDVLGSTRGKLRLIFSKSGTTLYATDSGGGFHRGAPEPVKPVSGGPVSTGRLPAKSPPSSPQK